MFSLPPLRYDYAALEPVVSKTTMQTHHGKHHKSYVDKTNTLLAKTGATPDSLESVIARAAGQEGELFNNAAQAWNHAFFWECMSPARASAPEHFQALRDRFLEEGVGHFGSGWVWIAAKDGRLTVLSTHDADTLAHRSDVTPVLLCDLWEHAYYLDYKNDRKGFLQKWFDEVADWRFAEVQWRAAQGQGERYRYPGPTTERGSIGEAAQTAARPA